MGGFAKGRMHNMYAREIMTREVITVSPDDTVRQLARVLTEGGISGAPVLDADRNVVGIVSEADVVSKRGSLVKDVMGRRVVAVEEDDTVEKVCCVLSDHSINRAPVLRNGELVGIITRTDVVRAIAAGSLNTDLTPTSDAQTAPA